MTAQGGSRGGALVLAAVGAASLVGFAAVGWALRGLRGGGPAAPPAPPAAVATVAETVPRGKLVFQVHCARCHGPEGRGDGPDSATLRPPPRDFRGSAWLASAARGSVRRAVAEGVPNSMMPGFGSAMSSRELDAVVGHVLDLGLDSVPVPHDLIERAGFIPAPDGSRAPRFSARGGGGEEVSTDRLRDRLVLVVFWGTGCAPCLKELPEVAALAGRFRDDRLAVVPLCVDETDPDAARLVAGRCAPGLPVYVDPTGMAPKSYQVEALPCAVLIAPGGRVLGRSQGVQNWSSPQMDSLVRGALGRHRRLFMPNSSKFHP